MVLTLHPRLAVAAACLIVAGACAPAEAPQARPAPTDMQIPSPTLPSPTLPLPSATETVRPDPYEAIDETLVAEGMDSGLTESEAVFLALTQYDAQVLGPGQYQIRATFPSGNTADMTVTLKLDQIGDPESDTPLSVVHSETDEGFTFRLEYFVPYDTIPAEVLEQIRGQAAGRGPVLALAGGELANVMTAVQSSGLGVVVEAIVKKFVIAQVKDFVAYLDKRLGANGKLDNLLNAVRSALSVKDAFAMRDEYAKLMKQIDELEDCARNPTNEVTRREYERNPGEKQRVLDALDAARSEIKGNLAVMYLGLLNQTGARSVESKVPGLRYLVGGATAWSLQTLRHVNAQLIEELRRAIPKCEFKVRIEWIAEHDLLAHHGRPGNAEITIARQGVTEFALQTDDADQISGDGPMALETSYRQSDPGGVRCEADWVNTFTISVLGEAASDVLKLRIDWNPPESTSTLMTCTVGDITARDRDSIRGGGGGFPASSPLGAGFEIEAKDGASKTFEFPDPTGDVGGTTVIIVTLLRESD